MKLLPRVLVIALATLGSAACSSISQSNTTTDGGQCSASGSATLSGTLQGATLSPKDAVVVKSGGSNYLTITDFADACGLGTNGVQKNSNVLAFDFYSAPIAPGTHQVGQSLSVQYAAYDQTCNSPNGESATAGTVTITGTSACAASGTFDVTLGSDHVTGSFKAAICVPVDGGTTCR